MIFTNNQTLATMRNLIKSAFFIAFTLFLLQSNIYAQVNEGLISKYAFTGNANDTIGNYNGIVYGATLTTDRFGNSNSAYHFNSDSSQYIEVPYNPDFTPGEDPMSISVWFMASPNNTTDGLIIDWYRCGVNPSCSEVDAALYTIGLIDSNKVYYHVRDDFNNDTSFVTSTDFNDDSWHHAVLIFDPGMDYLIYYLDNIQLDSVAFEITSLSDGNFQIPFSIGRHFREGWGDPGLYFNGKIDDIRIYNRAISAIEVDSLFNESNSTLGISTSEIGASISVFPNPSSNNVNVVNNSNIALQFTLYNSLGEIVIEKALRSIKSTIDLSANPSGVYFYKVTSESSLIKTGKIIKQ